MYVCLCKGVTDNHIREAVNNGASSFKEVAKAHGLGSQCGKCAMMARDIFREELSKQKEVVSDLFYAAI
ncbi:MAG: bacterioferritin-associated ferredoxin [Pseudomonadales bacterium]|nr:bacterioferritin-associated ferredoxin [Pseudomonadales bacterium]